MTICEEDFNNPVCLLEYSKIKYKTDQSCILKIIRATGYSFGVNESVYSCKSSSSSESFGFFRPCLDQSIPNRLANRFCIHVFAKKSKKHLSNSLVIVLYNFVNLANREKGLAYMPSPSALGIASLARNPSPPRVVAQLLPPPTARFSFLPSD